MRLLVTFALVRITAVASARHIPRQKQVRNAVSSVEYNGRITVAFSSVRDIPVVPIAFSAPGLILNLILDSGSSTTWVRSSLCEEGNFCGANLPQYEVWPIDILSDVFITSEVRSPTYFDSSFTKCIIVSDSIFIGKSKIKKHPFCAAVVAHENAPTMTDGVIGLAPNEPADKTNFIASFLESRFPKDQIISIRYNTNVNSQFDFSTPDHKPTPRQPLAGYVSFGPIDHNQFVGRMKWLSRPLESKRWEFPIGYIRIGNHERIRLNQSLAFLDTGATAIYLQDEPFDIITNMLENLGVINEDDMRFVLCDDIPNLPSLTFNIAGHEFTIHPDMYFTSLRKDLCILMIHRSKQPFNTLGAAFLRHFYTSFRLDTLQVGLAPLRDY